MYRKLFLIFLVGLRTCIAVAQTDIPVFKGGIKENRDKFYNNAVAKNIVQALQQPLNAATEEDYVTAFGLINLLQYKDSFVNKRIDYAIANMQSRSNDFKRALVELVYADYPHKYIEQVKKIIPTIKGDVKLLALAANYVLKYGNKKDRIQVQVFVNNFLTKKPNDPLLAALKYDVLNYGKDIQHPSLAAFFAKDYLPKQVLVLSVQRKNRDYPGLALVRDTNDVWLRNADSSLFAVGQLARAGGNTPYYVTNGNTPQGIFRMSGFGVSKSFFIGPTVNIQLTMPFEFKANHFYRDTTLSDSAWSLDRYKKLLPQSWQNYFPILGTWYAGKAGRNEIIAHGTTMDPEWYKGKPYYPFAPTAGCLATEEWWDSNNGQRQKSGQVLLTEAVKKAGGANGYFIVVEIDDKASPVAPKEVSNYLK